MNKPPYEFHVGRIDERDRVEINYSNKNRFKLYIPCQDFERLSMKNQLRQMLQTLDDVLTQYRDSDDKLNFEGG
jgi:hypothetical protein